MRLSVAAAVLLSAAAAYYVYLPLPPGVCEPWKLMLLDAVIRSAMTASNMAHEFGLCHRAQLLNWFLFRLDEIPAHSSPAVNVSDAALGGVPTRVYQPRGGQRPRRGVIYFHGGGWAVGSPRLRSFDLLCRKMAEDLDAVVMSVDYGLVPEAVFPDQYLDALSAARSFLSAETQDKYGLDPSRLCISGDSAGGNLAAAVTQTFALDPSVPGQFKLQALIYPVLQALDFHTSSYQQNQAVPILYRPIMARFWLQYLNTDPGLEKVVLTNSHSSLLSSAVRSKINWTSLIPAHIRKHYLPVKVKGSEGLVKGSEGVVRGSVDVVIDSEGVVTGSEGVVKGSEGVVKSSEGVADAVPVFLDVRAAPLLAESDVLSRTPKAYVMTCEFDVVRDDGLMYAARLRDAGVAVTNDHYENGFHGCMVFAHLPMMSAVGRRSMDNLVRWLDQNL